MKLKKLRCQEFMFGVWPFGICFSVEIQWLGHIFYIWEYNINSAYILNHFSSRRKTLKCRPSWFVYNSRLEKFKKRPCCHQKKENKILKDLVMPNWLHPINIWSSVWRNSLACHPLLMDTYWLHLTSVYSMCFQKNIILTILE